jgi:hypothetical protein
MARGDRRKCKCCLKLFRPDPRNRRHQRYCSTPACRRASKGASQARWLAQPENHEIGCRHFVLGTDYGIRAAPTPVQGMRTMIASLLDYEFTVDEIRTMTAINPARLIGLEPL